MNWMWFIGAAWLVVSVPLAVIVGRSIRLASLKAEERAQPERAPSARVRSLPVARPVDRRSASIRRQTSSSTGPVGTPLSGGCVSPAQRVPFEHEHGVL